MPEVNDRPEQFRESLVLQEVLVLEQSQEKAAAVVHPDPMLPQFPYRIPETLVVPAGVHDQSFPDGGRSLVKHDEAGEELRPRLVENVSSTAFIS
jgi:hypothetical protein